MLAGTHSAEKMGTVADLGPIPKPRKKRAINRCHHVFVHAIQMHVANEIAQVSMMVPRRPKARFSGSVSQHPIAPQQRYGAPFTRPSSQRLRSLALGSIPNWRG